MVKAGRRVVLIALLGGVMSAGTTAAPTEYQVKAAFLYNFAKFIQWPPDSLGGDAPFVVTILGHDPFGPALDETLQGKTVDSRRIVLRRASRVEELGPSHIVFISDSEKDRLPAILRGLGTKAVLTVGEMSRFAERGGVIRLKVDHERIRFEINLAAAERSRLRVSSQLLKVAQIVDPGNGG